MKKNCLLRLLNFSGRVLFASDIILSFKELLQINFYIFFKRWVGRGYEESFENGSSKNMQDFFFLATGHFRAYF